MSTKIQKLLEKWPQGAIKTVSGLKESGYSQSLINHYRKSGWINSVADGVVIRAGDTPTIFSAVATLQNDLKLDVRIGGITALELLGGAHYIRKGESAFHLFGNPKRLPTWVRNYDWKEELKYHSTTLFKEGFKAGLKSFSQDGIKVSISNQVQALLEFLSLVPMEHTAEEAKELMGSLTTPVPAKVQQLLGECHSYKVKRLFLLLADECNHAWFNKLDITSIDLGKGSMSLSKGGRYSKKYKLIVPEAILTSEER
jgi:hypothetical protein